MKNNHRLYYAYSDHLKERYGEKVYKLPVNLPVSCPNRTGGKRGCSFCAGCGTGFEAMGAFVPVREQLEQTKQYIGPRYHAHKFIAYFQNYTNTFLPLPDFRRYAKEAAEVPDLVGISVSTRPDCVRRTRVAGAPCPRQQQDILNKSHQSSNLYGVSEAGNLEADSLQ